MNITEFDWKNSKPKFTGSSDIDVNELLDRIGTESFAGELRTQISDAIPLSSICVSAVDPLGQLSYRWSNCISPEMDEIIRCGLDRYKRFFYVDPLYAHISRLWTSETSDSPLTLIYQSSIEDAKNKLWKSSCYADVAWFDRLVVGLGQPGMGWLGLVFFRHSDGEMFSAEEVAWFRHNAPLLLRLLMIHEGLRTQDASQQVVAQNTSDKFKSLTAALSEQETSVCMKIIEGKTSKCIAKEMGVAPSSVKTYRQRAFMKLGIRKGLELPSLVL